MRRHPLTTRARSLRAGETDAERLLWSRLRNRQLDGFKFKRQVPFEHCILDFACLEERLAIELDGGQHMECEAADLRRTQSLEASGWRVLRFWNDQVFRETDGVLEAIRLALLKNAPHPNPLPVQTAHGERE